MRRLFAFGWGWVASMAAGVALAAEPTAWLPAGVNAVARVNVAEIYKSPLAKKEGWLKQATESFIQQEGFIPPGTQQIVMGAELELSDVLSSHHQYAVLVPEKQLTLEKLSAWLPGPLEQISGKKVAQYGTDGYVVDAGDGCWLATSQGGRQGVARWLKSGPDAGGLSPYLKSALATPGNKAQMLVAIDLQDSFSRNHLVEVLRNAAWLPPKASPEALADILASAKGLTIALTVDDDRSGAVTLDFDKETTALQPILGSLVDVILDRVGASSNDFTAWKWTVGGKRINGSGPVSPGGGRRLLSILEPPSLTQAIAASTEDEQPKDPMPKSSLKYCKSLQVLLKDLQTDLNKSRDNQALWFERYARKMDDLPKLHVDGALLDYGTRVSSSLRYQAQARRMSNLRYRSRTAGSSYTTKNTGIAPFSANYYGASYTTASTERSAVEGVRAEENQAAKEVQFSEWQQIEDGLVDIRRQMTEKYQMEF